MKKCPICEERKLQAKEPIIKYEEICRDNASYTKKIKEYQFQIEDLSSKYDEYQLIVNDLELILENRNNTIVELNNIITYQKGLIDGLQSSKKKSKKFSENNFIEDFSNHTGNAVSKKLANSTNFPAETEDWGQKIISHSKIECVPKETCNFTSGRVKNTSSLITDYSGKKSMVAEIEYEAIEEAPAGSSIFPRLFDNIVTPENRNNNYLEFEKEKFKSLEENVQIFLKGSNKQETEPVTKKGRKKSIEDDKDLENIRTIYFGQKEVEYSSEEELNFETKDKEIEMKKIKKKNKK